MFQNKIRFNCLSKNARLSCAMLLGLLAHDCHVSKSKKNALESDDFFRNGVDRFYLATVKTDTLMEGSKTSFVGQDVLIGIGCYGESKDRAATIQVPADSCNKGTENVPLNQRKFVHQFKMTKDKTKPEKGECTVLLGNLDLINSIQNLPNQFSYGPGATAKGAVFSALGFCGLTVGLMVFAGPLSAKLAGMANFGKGTGAVVGGAVGGASKSLAVAEAGIKTIDVVAKSADDVHHMVNVAGGAMVLASKPTSALVAAGGAAVSANTAGTAAAAVGPLGRVINSAKGMGAAVGAFRFSALSAGALAKGAIGLIPCGSMATSFMDAAADGQKNKNRSAFFKGLATAEKQATAKINANPELSQAFKQAVSQNNLAEAAAIFNPVLVSEFNASVVEKFENGWGWDRKDQKFFDMVDELSKELNGTAVAGSPGSPTSSGTPQSSPNPAETLGVPK